MNNIPQSTTLSNTTAGTSCFDANHIDVTTIEDLEQVGSDKWTRYPGCIGAFIAVSVDFAFACSVCENMASWSSALIMCAASCFAITSFRYESSICCRVIFLTLLSKANINSPMNLWVS